MGVKIRHPMDGSAPRESAPSETFLLGNVLILTPMGAVLLPFLSCVRGCNLL